MKKIPKWFSLLALLWLGLVLVAPALKAAPPYQAQKPQAELGSVKLSLIGPPDFTRVDGLDRHLDDILLATQPPSAAVMAIFAEPKAWAAFSPEAPEQKPGGLSCHALISTPAPLAQQNISSDDFDQIKKNLVTNLEQALNQERRLENELSDVSDHQVEQAKGKIVLFKVLDDQPNLLTYRLDSTLELKYKKEGRPRISRSTTISSTICWAGKIINLQITATPDGPPVAQLEKAATAWRADFLKANAQEGSTGPTRKE